MGADGTTIWAAATSGKGAIAVHLLACMLARIWTGPEATSIWVELVAQRKQELARLQCNDSVYLSNLAASQVFLGREQLRDWDASARSWLQSADKEKNHQQLQLMLILNNIKLPVNSSMDVYEGVIQTWKQALETAEDLLKGMPQRVQDGAILLGISAWHLYPNMLVLGDCNTTVEQNDPLVSKGGILTIGLKILSPDKDDGVFWSLPLAHLCYYGDPVRSTRSMGTNAARVPMEAFIQVALGSACSMWSKARYDIFKAAQLIVSLMEYISRDDKATPSDTKKSSSLKDQGTLEWFRLLYHAASAFLKSSGLEQKLMSRLASFGQRRGSTFLAASEAHLAPYFGLADYSNLFELINWEEDQIKVLRNIAEGLNAEHDDLIIRYRVRPFGSAYHDHFEYASAIPAPRTSVKRTQDGQETSPLSHRRWILDWESIGEDAQNAKGCACLEACLPPSCPCASSRTRCTVGCHSQQYHDEGLSFYCRLMHTVRARKTALKIALLERAGIIDRLGEQRHNISYAEKTKDLMFAWNYKEFSGERPAGPPKKNGRMPSSVMVTFKILLGDPDTAAIFRRQDPAPHLATQFQRMKDQSILDTILRKEFISKVALRQYMSRLSLRSYEDDRASSNPSDSAAATSDADERFTPPANLHPARLQPAHFRYFYSLTALSVARRLYCQLPDALVDLEVTTKPLHAMTWVPATDRYGKMPPLTKAQAFACIALFETGNIVISPRSLEQVMALSSGSSLFVAVALLEDPWEVSDYGGMHRLAGNIGKAGLNLLVPPPKPRIRALDLANWGVINHWDFEGKVEDCFRSTSLHLSFTDYQLPIDTGVHGKRDGEAFFLESLVSVLDRGEWVADIDVLGMIESKNFYRIPNCTHQKKEAYNANGIPGSELISVESWPEFLDPPNSACITHTLSNSYARIATAALSIQKGTKTLILPDKKGKICWPCVYKHSEFGEADDLSSDSEFDDSDGSEGGVVGQNPADEGEKAAGEQRPWILIA
jgi:hypothetical protein